MRRTCLRLSVFLIAVTLLVGGGPPALAQSGSDGTPRPAACGPDQATPGLADSNIILEAEIARQPILDANLDPLAYDSTITLRCLPPDIRTDELFQRGPVSLTVVSGEVAVELVKSCSFPEPPAADCAADSPFGPFVGAYYPSGTNQPQPLTAAPITLTAGDVLVLADVTFILDTMGTTGARVIAAGVTDRDTGGGACPCTRFP